MDKQQRLEFRRQCMERFSMFLKQLRQERGLTVKEMADILKISPSTIRNWEKMKGRPLCSHIYTICNKFKISADDIIGL